MINTVMLVGRLVNVEEKENSCIIKLIIMRKFKEDGIYKNDIINIQVSKGISTKIKDYIQKNDLVGVRGCLRNIDDEMVIIAESITTLGSKKEVENETD